MSEAVQDSLALPAQLASMTVGGGLRQAARRLAHAGVATPLLDARLLVCHAAGLTIEELLRNPDRLLPPDEAAALEALLSRRLVREPVSRILGRREFWGLDFCIGPETLDPRPDSETLVEAVLSLTGNRDRPWRILDLGTGSGCLLLALLSELPRATGVGVDINGRALFTAHENAHRLGLAERAAFLCGNWGASLAAPFDIVISNPPYIPDTGIDCLEPEVALYEPRISLDGGVDGMDSYRKIIGELRGLMAETGYAVLELGACQAGSVSRILAASALRIVEIRKDLKGFPRCVVTSR